TEETEFSNSSLLSPFQPEADPSFGGTSCKTNPNIQIRNPTPFFHSTLIPRHFFLLHPHEAHIELLLQRRLKIRPVELIVLPIVSQRIGTAGVIGRAQLDENIQLRAVVRSFSPGDVDGIWVEIDRVDLAARIDILNFENVAAVEPEPTAIQRLKTAALSSEESDGSNNAYDRHQD